MKVSQILDKAADVIERNGHHKSGWYDPDPVKYPAACRVCEGGAINLAVVGRPDIIPDYDELPGVLWDAYEVMAIRARPELVGTALDDADDVLDPREVLDIYIEAVARWNDDEDRTADEVVAELRAAAAIERGQGR